MPELPEVHTTAKILNKLLKGLKIEDVWTDYKNPLYKNQIKNPLYFKKFKDLILGAKITSVSRIGKNILINLDNRESILVHMKMTGHLLYGKYSFDGKKWSTLEKGSLEDPFNQFIHLVFSFSNKKHLVLSDVRKFAKVSLLGDQQKDIEKLGPNPLLITLNEFKEQLKKRSQGKIKTVLLDQNIFAGIGNIYSDEALFASKIHPAKQIKELSHKEMHALYRSLQNVLKKGVDFGGDSTSDYRNPYGEKGKFQYHHKVYREKNKICPRKGCKGRVTRMMVGARSSHFCPICQEN